MTAPAISTAEFRAGLGSFASGVVAITGTAAGVPRGLACQSFFSLSLDPQLVAIAIARSSTSWPAIARSGHFCANVLSADQVHICSALGRPGEAKFDGLQWQRGTTGSPRFAGSIAWIECAIEDVHPAGDHVLVVARVEDIEVGTGQPLLYYRGEFGCVQQLREPANDRESR